MLGRRVGGLLALLLVLVPAVGARTLTLGERDIDRLASVSEQHPRSSWAGVEGPIVGMFNDSNLGISSTQGVLLRYPLDQIPPGQRIVHAELTVPYYSGADWYRLFVWRLTTDWGPGVCHLFKQTRPEKLPWAMPGARGAGVDRATEPTRIVRLKAGGLHELLVDVTLDVQLWYNGTAKNHGWLLTAEDEGHSYFLYSWAAGYGGSWRLRITYEPR